MAIRCHKVEQSGTKSKLLAKPLAIGFPSFLSPYCFSSYGWRRGSESNRRIRLLQSPALPLGYPAIRVL